jgi:DNA polymerase-3 subunit gamma/tau
MPTGGSNACPMVKPGYVVLARKYRPRRFADLVGQPHIVAALSNAILTNRVAQAFLLTGSRGTGKTTTARLLACALNCQRRMEKEFEPCGECPSCIDIGSSDDLDVIEMDAASNSRVDDIRDRLQTVETRPARGKFRIFIIDEVHMLSTSAFNALLKTVEEPPPHVKFILATTNPEKIPETILSRCQRYDFRRATSAEIVERLQQICATEGAEPGEGLLRAIAEIVEGGMRDALSRLDQLFAFCGLKPTVADAERVFGLVSRPRLLELLEKLAASDAAAGILFAEDVFDSGKDVAEVLASLVALVRVLLLIAASGGDSRAIDVPEDELPRLKAVAKQFGITGLVYTAELLTDCRNRIRRAAFPRVVVETTLVKLALVGRLESVETLLSRLNEVSDAPTAPPPAAQSAENPPAKRGLSDREQAAVEALRRQFGAK